MCSLSADCSTLSFRLVEWEKYFGEASIKLITIFEKFGIGFGELPPF